MKKKLITFISVSLGVLCMSSPVFAEDFILCNENGLYIETKGLSDAPSTNEIGLYMENNSDLSLGVAPYAYAINGIMAGGDQYGFNSTDIAPGKKANATIKLVDEWNNKDFFKDYQIDTVSSFDALFWAYDNDKSFKAFDSGQIHADLSGIEMQDSPVFSDCQTIYDQNGVKVDFISKDGNNYNFCVTNTTGNYFTFDVENETYNDFTSSDANYDLINVYVLNNCKLMFTVKPTDEFLSSNGIGDITKVDFSLSIKPLAEYSSQYSTDLISYVE